MGCDIMRGFDFAAMDKAVEQTKKFELDFVTNYQVDSVRKVLKKLRKQFHIDEIAYSGDRGWYFDPDTGDMVEWNTGCKYKIRYWHHDPDYGGYRGKVNHLLVF